MNYNFRGTYDPSQDYNKLDVVIYKKSANDPKRIFLCLTSHTSATPQEPNPNMDTPYWGILNSDSSFPETIDSFLRSKNMTSSDVADVNRYQQLFLKTNRTPEEDVEMNSIADRLKDKQISPDDINKLKSAIENLQFFFKSEVEGYINQKKIEFDSAIGQFKDVGAYSPTTNYYAKNMVKFNGNVYIAKQDNIGKTPVGDDNDPYWRLLSLKGDTGQAGISVNYKGDYNNSVTYNVGDGVSYFGNLYYAKQTTTGNLPTNSDYWHLADKIYVGTAPPAAPQSDQVWLDISLANPKYMFWNGTSWVEVKAGDADKLGGQLPSYYATAQSVTDNSNKIGDLSNLQTTAKGNLVDAVNEVQQEINAHSANYISHVPYAVASGSANTYAVTLSPVPSAYVEGMAIAVKINVQNTGASTLNVNGLDAKPIKKANGNDVAAGNLKAGSIYTLRYNGTNFILQGEGGEYGTAGPAQVLSGYTIGTENGLVSGTMPNNGAINQTITTQGGQFTIPAGYHNGQGKVTANFANLTPENIRKGVNVGGIVGTSPTVYGFANVGIANILSTDLPNSYNVFSFDDNYMYEFSLVLAQKKFQRKIYNKSGILISTTDIITYADSMGSFRDGKYLMPTPTHLYRSISNGSICKYNYDGVLVDTFPSAISTNTLDIESVKDCYLHIVSTSIQLRNKSDVVLASFDGSYSTSAYFSGIFISENIAFVEVYEDSYIAVYESGSWNVKKLRSGGYSIYELTKILKFFTWR